MSIFESLLNTFETGSGFWNPIVWLVVIIIVFLIIHILRGFGNKNYKVDTEQTNRNIQKKKCILKEVISIGVLQNH